MAGFFAAGSEPVEAAGGIVVLEEFFSGWLHFFLTCVEVSLLTNGASSAGMDAVCMEWAEGCIYKR